MSVRRVVVVGAGPAGARCAARVAERMGPRAQVTLIGAEPDHPYNRVGLSALLAGDVDEAALVTHDRDHLDEIGVRYLPGTDVTAIDRAAQTLATARHGAIGYDALVLALGADPVRLPLPGADRPGVLMYRTLDDVRRMLAAPHGSRAVVIGGGLLGLEAAAGLARRGVSVTVLHAMDRLMERQLDHGAAAMLADRLRAQGMDVVLSARTTIIDGDAAEGPVRGVRLSCGRTIAADMVVLAVGIRPRTALAREAGLSVARGIVVDDVLLTSDPAIFAIGECAEHRSTCIGLVAPALAQAESAACVIAGTLTPYVAATATGTALKVAGAGVWSAGEIDATDAEDIVMHDAEQSDYRRLSIRDGRLIGAVLYGDVADAGFYLSLIEAGGSVQAVRPVLAFGPAFLPAIAA